MTNENSSVSISGWITKNQCGYFKGKTSSAFLTTHELFIDSIQEDISPLNFYYILLRNGFRRYNNSFYLNKCEGCSECIPIRIPVKDFKLSKSQKAVWHKNQDIEIILQKEESIANDVSSYLKLEKCALFRDYDEYHNKEDKDYVRMTLAEASENLKQMVSGYPSVWNMEYYADGKLAGVGVLDYAEDQLSGRKALSSNYFYYDTIAEIKKRSLGVYSVLKEIELCRIEGIEYYYLGLYLEGCKKMNYKARYKPFELFIDGEWKRYP